MRKKHSYEDIDCIKCVYMRVINVHIQGLLISKADKLRCTRCNLHFFPLSEKYYSRRTVKKLSIGVEFMSIKSL